MYEGYLNHRSFAKNDNAVLDEGCTDDDDDADGDDNDDSEEDDVIKNEKYVLDDEDVLSPRTLKSLSIWKNWGTNYGSS